MYHKLYIQLASFIFIAGCYAQPAQTPVVIFNSPVPSVTPPSINKNDADQTVYSPNGLLVAKRFRGPSLVNEDVIEIQDSEGSILWKIPFEGVILGSDGNVWIEIPAQGEQWKGEPNPSIHIYEWSLDNQYLYYYYHLFVDGYQPLMASFDLQRININTGSEEKVIPGTGRLDFSFSPNQEYLVYTRDQDTPRCITVRKTSDNTEESISIPEWNRDIEIGGFSWSPYDNNEFTFLTFSEDWERIQVHFLDINKMSTTFIIEFWREELWYDTWLPNNTLRYITFPENEITEINIAQSTPIIIGIATISPTP